MPDEDNEPTLEFKRRTLAEVMGAWLGGKTRGQINAAYAEYQRAMFPPIGKMRESLGA